MPSRPIFPRALAIQTLARFALVLGPAALAVGASGCTPQVGDPCDLATDCSPVGELLCDTTQPGGYCTQFNCEPGRCTDDSLCIAFRARESIELACDNPQVPSRFERTFCMATCSDDGDCRTDEGYACVDMNLAGNPYGAVVVEENDSDGRICVLPYENTGDPGNSTEVCTGAPPAED